MYLKITFYPISRYTGTLQIRVCNGNRIELVRLKHRFFNLCLCVCSVVYSGMICFCLADF